MKGIDIIIPVHKYDEGINLLLKRSLSSIKEMAIKAKEEDINCEVFVVGPNSLPLDILDLLEWEGVFNLSIVENNGDLDFCSQVNFAVTKVCENDYFMIVEMDDMVTPKWINMAMPYINKRKECPIFLPLTETYDILSPKTPLFYLNEIAWSSSFVENELGVLTNSLLQDYCNFNITGAIIRREDFIKAGKLKPSIKLSFGYELLLRLTHLYNEAFVVPKVGYFHFVNREDSLTSEYHKTMTKEEGSWWIKLAIEEYQYKKDRNKTYTPEE